MKDPRKRSFFYYGCLKKPASLMNGHWWIWLSSFDNQLFRRQRELASASSRSELTDKLQHSLPVFYMRHSLKDTGPFITLGHVDGWAAKLALWSLLPERPSCLKLHYCSAVSILSKKKRKENTCCFFSDKPVCFWWKCLNVAVTRFIELSYESPPKIFWNNLLPIHLIWKMTVIPFTLTLL